MSGIGSHQSQCAQSDTWLTPQEIIHALGPFDLDPCAAPEPRPWLTATRHITLPTDGLAEEWNGRIWLNPPYGPVTGQWMEKMATHSMREDLRSVGIALVFARTETEFWKKWIWPFADSVMFLSGRIHFRYPDGTRAKGNAGGPSALIAYSEWDSFMLAKSGIDGVIVVKDERRERMRLAGAV